MKIDHLIRVIDEMQAVEARRGNYGRQASRAAGQQLGRDIAAGLPKADQTAAIQRGQKLAQHGQGLANLQSRAQQAAAPSAKPAAPAQPTGAQSAATPAATPSQPPASSWAAMTAPSGTKSSSGGTTQKTPTGVLHTASASNPNQPAPATAGAPTSADAL